MKQFINSICNSLNNRNQTMKYILTLAMFFALSTSVLAEGGARVFEFSYSHRIKFTDLSNNPGDALGISSPVVGANIIGGADCVPGIANCVGGSNAVGSVDSVYYIPGSTPSDPKIQVVVPSLNQYKRVKMGKYYNPNVLSKTDKTFSGLTSLTFTLTKGANQVWSTTINFADITNNSASPFTFNQSDDLTFGTWLGEGSIYKDDDGAIHFTSAPLITSTLDENSDFTLTVTPTASSASIVTTPLTRVYLGETLVSQAPKTGETKYSSHATNHEGWYLMDGTANASITNVNARAAAYMIFGGAGGNIPNMDGLYTVAETTTGQAYTAAGVVNNEIIVNNSNINQANLSTATDGVHVHNVNTGPWGLALQDGNMTNNGTDLDFSPGEMNIQSNVLNNWQVDSSNSSHSHSFSIGTATPTPISIQPRSAKLYQFVYLGQ